MFCVADDERSELYNARIVKIIGTVLLSTTSEAARAKPPFYAESVVMESIYKMPGLDTRAENLTYLWTQVWHCGFQLLRYV